MTNEITLPNSPYDLFQEWLTLAERSEPNDPNAMCLATSTKDGTPSARMVLLKGLDERGFVFYTNADSNKGNQIDDNPKAAICFHWKSLRKQVRVEGEIIEVSKEEADAYYNTRHRGSRIGAWASKQSRPLKNLWRGMKKNLKVKKTSLAPKIGKGFESFRIKLNFGSMVNIDYINDMFIPQMATVVGRWVCYIHD